MANNAKSIGLDMDGVIIDHSPTIIAWAAKRGRNLAPKQTTIPNLKKIFNDTELDELYEFMYESPKAMETYILMVGASAALDKLNSGKYQIHILSRRASAANAQATLEHFGLWPSLFNSSNTYFVDQSSQKLAIAQRLGVTHYVEDQPNALLATMNPINHRILFDQFKSFSSNSEYLRITSWPLLLKALTQ